MNPRDTLTPVAGREQELQRELQRAYENLTEITSRLLLANEAVEATLSTHDRTELSERFLRVVAHGSAASRSALFLVEGEGFSVGATLGLSEEEQEALPASEADIDTCRAALEAKRPQVADPALMAADALDELEQEERAEAAEAEEELESEEEGDGAAAVEDGDGEEDEPAGQPFFGVYIPVHLDGAPIAVLALGARARGERYAAQDLTFLRHLLSQYAVALNRGTLIEQNEHRLAELDALLRVSREITSTLDLDAVLRAVVNTVAAVLPNDRAAIALMKARRLSLRAVSSMTRLAPDQAEIFHLEGPLEYLALEPRRLQIGADGLGGEEDPPGASVFSSYFERQEMRSFMAVPLKDDQGLLGFLILESRQEAWEVEPAEGDALDILAAQATVAIRNALLYSQIPLRGVALPMSKLRSKAASLDPRARRMTLAAAAVGLVVALLPIVPERTGGPAVVRPLRFQGVRAPTDGVVGRVFVKGGDRVAAGQPIAEVEDPDLASRLAELRAAAELARRGAASGRSANDPSAWRSAQVRLSAIELALAFEERRARASLLTAPFAGEVLELDLPQRTGQHLEMGESFCTVAALDSVEAVVEVPEQKIGRVRVGESVALKVMAFPAHTFTGRVSEVGWRGRPDAKGLARFQVRVAVANPGQLLRPGMSGIGKATLGRRSLAWLAIEPPLRAFELGWW
jgi:multidrug efflux pump subunit AcrA (membrane-fusion protein)